MPEPTDKQVRDSWKRCLTVKGVADEFGWGQGKAAKRIDALGIERDHSTRRGGDRRQARDWTPAGEDDPKVAEERRKEAEVKILRKRVKDLESKSDHVQTLVDIMRPAILVAPRAERIRMPKQTAGKGKEQEMVACLSDFQVGEKVREKDTGGYGEYNMEIFKQRLRYYGRKVVRIAELQRKTCPVKRLHVLGLGDYLEGIGIFVSQSAYLETDPIEQVFETLYEVGAVLRLWAENFDEVDTIWLAGNHGTIRSERGQTKDRFYVNWDFIFAQFLQQHMRETTNVKFEIPTSWWTIKEILGRKLYLEHGNYMIPYRHWGISWYSLERAVSRTLTLTRSIGKEFNDVIMGHVHVPFTWEVQSHMEVLCNGTFSGEANMLAAQKIKMRARPTQYAFFIHPEHGIASRFPVRLDTMDAEAVG